MKKQTIIIAIAAALAFIAAPSKAADDKKPKPYPLNTCIVSDEKLDDHGKPYVFTENGQEIKMCCKDCLKDFNKDKAKYLKKIEDAQKEKK